MKIDLLYEIRIPPPHTEKSEHQYYREALEQIEAADKAGFDCVWAVEPDFETGFAHSSAPEVLLTAAAARTERIRIGCGASLLPAPFNHPIRIAERIATLDIISNGRVEWCVGRSNTGEPTSFQVDPDTSRDLWQESLEMIPRMWERDKKFSHKSENFDIPERDIIPKPLQDPHPPIWATATNPASWQIAGRNGMGILDLTSGIPHGTIREHIHSYKAALNSATPVGKFINDQVGVSAICHCAETREQAAKDHAFGDLDSESTAIIGDVDHCLRKLETYRDAGCDRVLILTRASRIPNEAVLQSIELFGREIMPHFDHG
jgi:alkanesulfonate monooxygenase SsuD/methylene tetrahydromethanopterin reductase-like flavin-dependent oxidoreductase (luciferase family)